MCSSIHQFVILQRYSNLPNFGCPIIVPQIRVTGKYERAGHSLETTSIWMAAEQTPQTYLLHTCDSKSMNFVLSIHWPQLCSS